MGLPASHSRFRYQRIGRPNPQSIERKGFSLFSVFSLPTARRAPLYQRIKCRKTESIVEQLDVGQLRRFIFMERDEFLDQSARILVDLHLVSMA